MLNEKEWKEFPLKNLEYKEIPALDEKEWKDFEIRNLFTDIQSTKGKTTGELIPGDDLPYIAAAKVDNGFTGMYDKKSHEGWISKGNGIVFVQLGDGAAGLAYYIPMDFVGMNGKTSVGYFEELNKYNGLFLAKSLSINKEKFSHGHSWTGNRLLKTKVMLPINDQGEPDYEYMEKYAKNKRNELISRYKDFVKKQIKNLEYKEIPPLEEKEWKEFTLESVFSVSAGKRLTNANKIEGRRPFIGATDNNNGITGFVGNDNVSKDKNVLGVNYNGAPCIAFYHPYECIFTDDVKRLHLLNYEDNEFVLLFFATIIMNQKEKYSYGYKFKEKRMIRQKLIIPINNDGDPDYEYMEQYSKNVMLKKYQQYLDFLEKQEAKDQ